jgi:hypothetical protein
MTMSKKVVIFDTSVLCCWLKIPGKDTCGPKHDAWDFKRIEKKIIDEKKERSTFILPLAAIIETGNHITQTAGDRYVLAQLLAELIKKTAAGAEPWAVFSQQSHLWDNENLLKLADTWPELAAHQKLSIGDATIKDVADYYSASVCKVEILTGDQGLKRHEPTAPLSVPRRRKR